MKKINFKKSIAWILILVMMVGVGHVVAALGQSIISNVKSDDTTVVSSYCFAEKEALITEYGFEEGMQSGKILFGLNEEGVSQQWYLAGSDEEIEGENVVLVAANPIKTNQVFEDEGKSNKKDASLWEDCLYPSDSNITEVHPNHYGTSNLRMVLKQMLNNTYFSETEQTLMNATEICTYDTRNRVNYKTSDKLYILSNVNGTLRAGSKDNITVPLSNEEWVWLRTPNELMKNKGNILTANSENTQSSVSVSFSRAILPVTNLDLSSVLFASSVTLGDTKKQDDGVMTLRMDGSNVNMGNVLYDESREMVVVQRDTTAQNSVHLIVQSDTWYYSKAVDEATVVTLDMIKKELPLTSDISLKDCEIWIETTEATERIVYAKMAMREEVICDANGNGIFSVDDLVRYLRVGANVENISFTQKYEPDLNGDGFVNEKDIEWLKYFLVTKRLGD